MKGYFKKTESAGMLPPSAVTWKLGSKDNISFFGNIHRKPNAKLKTVGNQW